MTNLKKILKKIVSHFKIPKGDKAAIEVILFWKYLLLLHINFGSLDKPLNAAKFMRL